MRKATVYASLLMMFSIGCAGTSSDGEVQTSPVSASTGTSTVARGEIRSYPRSPVIEQADDYFGTRVSDPYRTLEDPRHPLTIAWTNEQNLLTHTYLARPERVKIKQRLTELFNYTRTSVPFERGGRYYFSRNEGLQDQPVYYAQDALNAEPRVVIDPNSLSPDGTVSLTNFSPTKDAKLLGYAISRGGSDRQEIYVRNLVTGEDLPEKIEWAKFTGIDWTPDGKGFFYSRYPEPGTVPAGDEHYFPKLYYHRAGTSQAEDVLIYERPREREVSFGIEVSDDGRYAMLTTSRGSSGENEIFVAPLAGPLEKLEFTPVFTGFDFSYSPIEVVGERLFVMTNQNAPRGKIIAVDLKNFQQKTDIVPESTDTLEEARIVDGKIVAHYLHNASSLLRMFDLTGKPAGEIRLPGIGTVSGMTGSLSDRELFFGFQSYTIAPSTYRYDFASGTLEEIARSAPAFDPTQYETTQVWYPSKDGTRVSMFLSHRKGMTPDPNTPLFLYGYGGFNVPMTPAFNPVHYYFIERGGIFAVPNLRGGSEYGEEWHKAGMLEKKQNVFDDFAAAAQWLISNRYTSKEKLAVSGRSNGGLLAAVMVTQQPDLFEAAVVQVPVIDMLRYHTFTVGRFWIPEYGSAEDPEQFKFLHAYSPLHNVEKGRRYPATLITTADTDDRVDPGQAKKFAATLQQAQGGDEPILIRIETKAGHSSGAVGAGGKPVSKLIEEWADIWTFVFTQLGMSN